MIIIVEQCIIVHGHIIFINGLCSSNFLHLHLVFLVSPNISITVLDINVLFFGCGIDTAGFGCDNVQKAYYMIGLWLGRNELAIKGRNTFPDGIQLLVIWEYTKNIL
jgi:hypothetical protein